MKLAILKVARQKICVSDQSSEYKNSPSENKSGIELMCLIQLLISKQSVRKSMRLILVMTIKSSQSQNKRI
jgi:hypothetical protein